MFLGHYGVSFAAKKLEPELPLWLLFIAVQLLDVLWAPFVLLGVEKVRIVPGFTATNPLDLYYMPYTHGLIAALLWSAVVAGGSPLGRRSGGSAGTPAGDAAFFLCGLRLLVSEPDSRRLHQTT